MQRNLAWAAGQLGLFALVLLVGVWLGHDLATTQAAAAKTRAAELAAARLLQAQAEGEAAVASVQEQLRLQKSYHSTLAERQRHAPLTAVVLPQPQPARRACVPGGLLAAGIAGPVAAGAGLAGGLGPGAHLAGSAGGGERAAGADGMGPGAGAERAGPASPAAGAQGPEADAVAPRHLDLRLSLAAVSLWNSALAGHDVPAGACWPAGTATSACAASAGTTFDEAWANHRANAASCAEDRARYLGLIQHLQTQQQRAQ